ncbi:MAG: DUF1289 domain-containing protein [Pseudomonadota bacterium]
MPETAKSGRPMSPCVSICSLDENDICYGCYRSVDEIVAWARMTAAEQHATIARAKSRAESAGEAVSSTR